MIRKSTNINKKQSPVNYLIEHKKTTTYDVGNPGPGLGS